MMNVILNILRWYLVLTGIGLIGFPVAFGFLKKLPGKGFVFSRPLGLILITFVYWLLGSLGLLQNNTGCLLGVCTAAAVLSFICWRKERKELSDWLNGAGKYCLFSEAVFFVSFMLIISFRLGGPEVSGTEKPMELMFINCILKSETFPPQDAWLSGYSISYYYFGYVMTAVLCMLSGVLSSVGFNLMLASVFAMAAEGAFGIINDLLDLRNITDASFPSVKLRSLFAPLFILITGNLEGLFEVFHSLHLFWNQDGTSSFWAWVGLKELSDAPIRPASWDPTGRSGIWWWRASRVVGDMGLEGAVKEVIDEFPMFSFELGDLHPHVLAIPFVLFAVGIALNALIRNLGSVTPGPFFAEGLVREDLELGSTRMVRWMVSSDFWLTALCIGALLFLNMWDFPFYFGLYCLCVTAAYLRNLGWNRGAVALFFETAFPLGAACILLYALFFLGFSSQAGGIALSGVFVTRPVHFLIMFGFFLVPILWWQLMMLRTCGRRSRRFGLSASLTIFAVLGILEILAFTVLLLIRTRETTGTLAQAADAFVGMQQITTVEAGFSGFFSRRLNALPTLLILFLDAGLAFALIRSFGVSAGDSGIEPPLHTDIFCSLMALIAAALVIFPEFFYLQDLFGTRMNTIFKFYYQAWILWGLCASYAVAVLWERLRNVKKVVFCVVMAPLLLAVMIYPYFCTVGKWESLSRKSSLTLDGAEFLHSSRADEWQALQWLETAEPGVVLEKVGSSYSGDNAVSTFTGLPAVLGWLGHESQWRGGYTEIGSRNDDVKRIYETHSWETAKELLDTYQIRYVFVGSTEKSAYNIQEKKFERNLKQAARFGGCTVYQVY